jgi:hypothetical protein
MITREQIAQLLKSISEAHYQIHSYGWGDVPDLLAREDVIYPFLMVTPSSSNYEEGYATHTYTISIADRVLKDKVNEVNVDSDTHQILLDILSQIDNLMYDDVDVVKGGTITPFFDNFRHEVTGHFADVGIRVKFAYDSCAVPSDIVPLPLPPPFECADASYRVQYVNGTLIEQGTIVSGGSKTINVPNPSTCDPASYEVRDANGSVLYSGTIASGGSQNIVVTNSTVVVRKSDNTIISSVSVLAQGSANYQVADSLITLTDTSAATISTTNVKATDPATIVAPNGTLNVNKSDGALISGQVVKSGETKGYNVADSVAVIKDSANTTLKSENIKATESENIVVNDSSVENSDASYSVNVLAEGSLVLPDSQINVNSVDSGDVVSVKTIDVNITDGVDPVTPTSVGLVGNTLTIEVPSGAPVNLSPYMAYGLRKIISTYTGNAAVVRRDSDNTTQNIGFSGNDFDVAAFDSFVGVGNGFCRDLFNQAGGIVGNAFGSTTLANQPQIITKGTKKVIEGRGALEANIQLTYGTPVLGQSYSHNIGAPQTGFTLSYVLENVASNLSNYLLYAGSPLSLFRFSNINTLGIQSVYTATQNINVGSPSNLRHILISCLDDKTYTIYVNGVSVGTGTMNFSIFTIQNNILSGGAKLAEYMVWNSGLGSSEISTLWTDIQTYYGL